VKILKMKDINPNNPLEGTTLATIVEDLVEHFGFEDLSERIPIKCFSDNPSIKSSLTFLRRTPWARKRVEDLYLWSLRKEIIRKRS
jgi:uncharacterized protein (DUF2132 family)